MKRKLIFLEDLMSNLNVSLIEYERTKYEVSIVKIPRIVIIGPNERVAISVISVPRIPTNTEVKSM